MAAVLIGVNGPLSGGLIVLGETETSLGRDSANSVIVDDFAVSRRHCLIVQSGARFLLRDLASRNGTLVNGALVEQHLLEQDDEIRVGASTFRFRTEAPDGAQPGSVLFDEKRGARFTTVLRCSDSAYLNPATPLLNQSGALPVLGHIQILLRVSRLLQTAQSVEQISCQLLQVLAEAMPAKRGAILLSPSADEFEMVFTWPPVSVPATSICIAPTLSRKLLIEGVAVIAHTEATPDEASCAVLATPLACFERAEGLLYLEAAGVEFGTAQLDLIAAIGSIAGLAIHNLRRLENLREENRRLETEIRIESDMVGGSRAMAELNAFIARVAGTDSTVLIGGETGTGKELVARAIHQNSPRARGPFVAINCAALTETLLEDELFGHERGAFTGAVSLKKGRFEIADEGTLFLDEVGELAPVLQAKLLRVLQHKEFERVGGTRPIRVNVRIVAASNRDLEAAVRSNAFRQDLYYRLNVISVTVPTLRERREDILLLAAHFAAKFSGRAKRTVPGISPRAQACLMAYRWPGNIRELENAIERSVVLGSGGTILPEDLPEAVLEAATGPELTPGGYHEAVVEAKRRVIRDALAKSGGVFTDAARLLDVDPNYLHRLVRNLGLRRQGDDQGSK